MAWLVDPERPVDQRPRVAAPRRICQRRPAPFIHPQGRHQPGSASSPTATRGRRNVGIGAAIQSAIDGTNAIAVRGVGRQAGVAVTVRADGGDQHKVGATCPLAAFYFIAGQAAPPGIGGGGPGQIDLGAPSGCRRQAGRIGGRSRIRTVVAVATFE